MYHYDTLCTVIVRCYCRNLYILGNREIKFYELILKINKKITLTWGAKTKDRQDNVKTNTCPTWLFLLVGDIYRVLQPSNIKESSRSWCHVFLISCNGNFYLSSKNCSFVHSMFKHSKFSKFKTRQLPGYASTYNEKKYLFQIQLNNLIFLWKWIGS